MLPSSHTHVQHRPSCKRGWKTSSASLVGLGTASREEVGGRGTRGWHGRDSRRIGKRVRVQRRKRILTKWSRRNLFQGINSPTKSGWRSRFWAEHSGKRSKVTRRTGPPSKLLPVCTQKAKGPRTALPWPQSGSHGYCCQLLDYVVSAVDHTSSTTGPPCLLTPTRPGTGHWDLHHGCYRKTKHLPNWICWQNLGPISVQWPNFIKEHPRGRIKHSRNYSWKRGWET